MSKYQKKPVIVEAFQLGNGQMPAWFMKAVNENRVLLWPNGRNCIEILNEHGFIRGYKGDYVIQGADDAMYVCDAKTFNALYMSAEETSSEEESLNN